ncbi:MAG: cysteine desulfurase, partial [Burkholderia sp.]
MTTPTPTADLASPGARAPAGLPDPATLARLANVFFASLPGQAAVGDAPAPAVGSGAAGLVPQAVPAAAPALAA